MTLNEMILECGGTQELISKLRNGGKVTKDEAELVHHSVLGLCREFVVDISEKTKDFSGDEFMILISAFMSISSVWKGAIDTKYGVAASNLFHKEMKRIVLEVTPFTGLFFGGDEE